MVNVGMVMNLGQHGGFVWKAIYSLILKKSLNILHFYYLLLVIEPCLPSTTINI